MKKVTLWISLLVFSFTVCAQSFSDVEKSQGYAYRNDTVYFVFDPIAYNKNANKVVVTGAFRGWTHDLEDEKFQLKLRPDGLFSVAIYNPLFETISGGSPFKFRVNSGDWLDPHSKAPNSEGGNLIFLKGVVPPRLRAEIISDRAIWIKTEGFERSLSAADYRLTDATGNQVKIGYIMPNTASETLLTPENPIDPKRVYYLEVPSKKLKTMVSHDGWFRHTYSNKELGANISADGKETIFRVFSPRSEKVVLYLYKERTDTKPSETLNMVRDPDGVWEVSVKRNLHKVWYDFTVHGAKEPGNYFYENVPVKTSDPYARVSDDSFGKSRVWEKTKPATPLKNGIPKLEDLVAWEVHVQDFTAQLPVADDLKGTISAMAIPGLKNSRGESVGFDHVTNLGINAIHLMPVQEYLHFPDDEWQEAFGNDPWMIEQGINKENYDWGYRTTHAFAIETRYRKKGTDHGDQRNQFRDMVQAYHDKGIAVLVDFVFNHTGENMDGRDMYFNFNVLDKMYYYRTKEGAHIGEYGNETKSENRPMMQRWIIDQCKLFIEEFGVDGFRIDLAGQTDEQTLLKLREALGPDIIVYGEPWIGSNDPDYEANPDWDWYKIDSPITFFQDDTRNALKGPAFFDPKSGENVRGWAGGDSQLKEKVKLALSAGFPEDKTPLSGINYLDIHDNWALADQFAKYQFDGRKGVYVGYTKIAATLLMTSLGPLVMHGGTEMLRSKGLAPMVEHVKSTKTGKIWFNGRRDTNTHRTANEFIWEDLGKTTADPSSYFPGEKSANDYRDMNNFWKNLIHFRLSEEGKVFRRAESVSQGYYQWLPTKSDGSLGYIVDGKVLVLLNTNSAKEVFFNVNIPEGNWILITDGTQFDQKNGISGRDSKLSKGTVDLVIPEESVKIWIKK